MRNSITSVFLLFAFSFSVICPNYSQADSGSPKEKLKEWTFLVFLNGNNNLDPYGTSNIQQMEQVGSTDNINIVVQWASLANKKTQRLFITKSTDSSKVTSPVLEDLGNVDMGDWRNLVNFVQWGKDHFPAKHYFINVWDHGSGWHALHALGGSQSNFQTFHPMDISYDETTGNMITTQQLGDALRESARIIGHKVDLYASDACLMAMAEIADEVSDSVDVYAGSEEVEQGEGWPYHAFLKRWSSKDSATPADVGTILTEEFVKSYNGGVYGKGEATFSAFNLAKIQALRDLIREFGTSLSSLDSKSKQMVVQLIGKTQNFAVKDYGDLTDFVTLLEKSKIKQLDREMLSRVKAGIRDFTIAHDATPTYAKAMGVSIWLPASQNTYNSYAGRYRALKFQSNTLWGDTLGSLFR